MAPVHVTSEIGPLRAVLVHTPGRELVAVTPGNREDYLYDDIIDLDLAQQEHAQLVAVLQRFAEVYEVRDLLTELVARPDVREFLVTRALEVVPSDVLARRLAQLAPQELVSLMVEGALEEAGPIARALNEVGYALPPLPNLFFTRDVGIVIGAHSIIGSMRCGGPGLPTSTGSPPGPRGGWPASPRRISWGRSGWRCCTVARSRRVGRRSRISSRRCRPWISRSSRSSAGATTARCRSASSGRAPATSSPRDREW